jgi:AmmeMemoRadiSam system protein B/AmmeMemoRadiSam system protein A
MKKLFSVASVLLAILFISVSCQSAEQTKDRPAAVAGSFYPADPAQLAAFVDDQLSRAAVPKIHGSVLAVVAPHAGYQFSGAVAAHSYALLRGKKYSRVVIVAPSHVEAFRYTSVFDGDAYTTPLGKISVDREFARKLSGQARSIRLASAGHVVREQPEHSLEVQLPFLQRVLGEFKLVPIVMGDQSYMASRDLGMALAKLLRNDDDTLLIASSDLSHFHPYDQATQMDHALLDGITNNDFLTVSHNLEAKVWEACGGAPIVAVMIAAQHLGGSSTRLLKYANSGDVSGDKNRVVGYSAVAILKDMSDVKIGDVSLTNTERSELLKIARLSVETAVRDRKIYEPPVPAMQSLRRERGVFVTLTENGKLRGCIGYGSPLYPLYLAVRDVAAYAALRDSRFSPVRPEELNQLQYEISVLSPFVHVLDPKTVRIGEHGLLVKNGDREGYLLPQVPVEQHWDRNTYLEQGALKAGLPSDAWQQDSTDLFIFTAIVFSDREMEPKK